METLSCAETTMLRLLVAVLLLTSCTVIVKLLVPEAVGVPVMAPLEAFRLRPAGRLPLVIDQVYGVLPPEAARV